LGEGEEGTEYVLSEERKICNKRMGRIRGKHLVRKISSGGMG
jgi:hypothetical protein